MATIIKSNEDVKDQILQLETTLSADIQNVDANVQAVVSNTATISGDIQTLDTNTQAGLSAVEGAVQSVEAQLVDVNTELDTVSSELVNVNTNLGVVDASVQNVVTELQTANGTLNDILTAVGGGAAGTSTETTVTAATTSTLLLAAEPTRSELYIRNNSTKDMWVHFGAGPAVAGKGILLSRQDALTDDIYTGAVYAIWDTGVAGSAEIIEVTP